jgi:glutaredoxin 3
MPKTVIYTTSSCGYCVRAKSLLEKKQIHFEEVDVTYDLEKRHSMMEKSGGRMTVPQIFIDEIHVGGYDDLYKLERSGQLDQLFNVA